MSEERGKTPARAPEKEESGSPFPELEAIQQEVEKRLRDNRLFLERFLDEDFEEDETEAEVAEGENFEEL